MDLRFDYLPRDEKIILTLVDWLFAAFGPHDPQNTHDRILAQLRERIQRDQVPLCLVAYQGDQPVATLSIIDDDMRTRPEFKPWIADLVVNPDLRGHGIGAAIFRRAEDEFRRLRVPTAYLFTWDHEPLYSRLGWHTFIREQYRDDLVAIMKRDF